MAKHIRSKRLLSRKLARAVARGQPSAPGAAQLSGRSLARLQVGVKGRPSALERGQARAPPAPRSQAIVTSRLRPRRSSVSNLKNHLRSKGSNPDHPFFSCLWRCGLEVTLASDFLCEYTAGGCGILRLRLIHRLFGVVAQVR